MRACRPALLALACALGAGWAQSGLDCRRTPSQARGYLAGSCDCFCGGGERLNHTATHGANSTMCGDVLANFSRSAESNDCQAARAEAEAQQYDRVQLSVDCCVPLTTDDPLVPEDYCGATPRGVCDLPELAAALEGLMQGEIHSSTPVEGFMLTRLERGLFCSCYRLYQQLSDRNVDEDEVPVAGECIGEAAFACPNQRVDYECTGAEIDSTTLIHGADCTAWCAIAGGAAQTCCETHLGNASTECTLSAFSEMASLSPGSDTFACVSPTPRVGDDVGVHAKCDAIYDHDVCEGSMHGWRCSWDYEHGSCSGRSSAAQQLYDCAESDGILDVMLLHPTADMIEQICPGDFARCQATDGCMAELRSELRNFGSCSDMEFDALMQSDGMPSLACFARICPTQMDACWASDECAAFFTMAMSNWQADTGPQYMPIEMQEVFFCVEDFNARAVYATCVDGNTCTEELYEMIDCNLRFSLQNPDGHNDCAILGEQCMVCYTAVGCSSGRLDPALCGGNTGGR